MKKISLIVIALFFIHNFLVVTNSLPTNPATHKTILSDTPYIFWFLRQGWSFFAPRPVATDLLLKVDCGDNTWHDPVKIFKDKSNYIGRLFRPSVVDYVIYTQVEKLVIEYNEFEEMQPKRAFHSFKKKLAYKRIKNICKQTCQAIGDSTPGTFRFKVLDISPTLYSKKDKSKENIIDEILFPNEKIN